MARQTRASTLTFEMAEECVLMDIEAVKTISSSFAYMIQLFLFKICHILNMNDVVLSLQAN